MSISLVGKIYNKVIMVLIHFLLGHLVQVLLS